MDSGGPPVLIFVLFGVIAAVAIIFSIMSSRARREAWRKFAASLGLDFALRDPFGLARNSPHPLFRKGRSRRVTNVAYGMYRGRSVRCFDYRYTVGYGKNSRTYRYTVVGVKPPVPFEQIHIRPEHFGDRLAEMIGFDDIDFESDEFSRSYYVKSDNKRFAYDLLHQRTMQFLLDRRDVVIEGSPHSLLFHSSRSGHAELPHRALELLDLACDFLDLTPQYLIEDRSR